LCIHEDGTVTEDNLGALAGQFPDARIVRRKEADAKLSKVLAAFPRSLAFRNTNLLAPKLFDFIAYLDSDRMALFDSDILFFSEPSAFLDRIEHSSYTRNTFNADDETAYTVDAGVVESRLGDQLHPRVNSGLGLVHRKSIDWHWIEEFLGLPGLLDGHFWRIEQTLFALCSSRFGVELLPDEYSVRLEPGIGGRPVRHYVGKIRHLMYGEGMARLVKRGFLGRAWSDTRDLN
jgi:hypothetical protein